MKKKLFQVQQRTVFGSKNKSLRRELILPGNVYGKSGSLAIMFEALKFKKLFEQVGETGVVYLQVEGNKQELSVLIDEVQLDPVTAMLLHVSFKEVDLALKVEAEIPIELIGEFDVPNTVLVQVKNFVEVEALPTDLPDKILVNLDALTKVGDMITLGDLQIDKSKIRLIEVENDEDLERAVVLVQEQRVEVEEPVVEPEEVEIIGEADKKARAEGKEDKDGVESKASAESKAGSKTGGKAEDKARGNAGERKGGEDVKNKPGALNKKTN